MKKSKKALISFFVVLNIGTACFMNRADPLISRFENRVLRNASPRMSYRMAWGDWVIEYYAYLTGLDPRWTMYGQLPKYHSWYRFVGKYANSKSVLFPLPFQNPMTFWQRTFFDFKEGKFYKNIYSDPLAQNAYARYIARKYPLYEGARLQYIVWEIYGQGLRNPSEARSAGASVIPHTEKMVKQVFQFPATWFDQ